jgi:hypothetical protein
MPWKLTEAGTIAVDDKGNPIFVQDGDNKEIAVDYAAHSAKMQKANAGEEKYRKRVAELEGKYKALADVEDVAAYVKAYGELTAENARLKENPELKQFEEKFQKEKTQLEKAWQDKEKSWAVQLEAQKTLLKQAEDKAKELTAQTQREKIRSMFNESGFIKEKCALAAPLLFELFSGKASVNDEGAFAGLDPSTNEVMLETDGKPASFDAWLFKVIDAHPNGKELLKGTQSLGAGGSPISGRKGADNPWMKDSYNLTEQNRLSVVNPELARSMAKAAGVTLNF